MQDRPKRSRQKVVARTEGANARSVRRNKPVQYDDKACEARSVCMQLQPGAA
jgi:hypothetical protein